jgi:uncharacterized protein (DUF736 family)
LRQASQAAWVSIRNTIRTLTINAKVRLVPNDDRTSKKAPTFRVFVGNSRIGEAWEARTRGLSPKDYLKVKLDDPMLAEPISAAISSEGGESAHMLWSRRRTTE